jgi:hypothetical protein
VQATPARHPEDTGGCRREADDPFLQLSNIGLDQLYSLKILYQSHIARAENLLFFPLPLPQDAHH